MIPVYSVTGTYNIHTDELVLEAEEPVDGGQRALAEEEQGDERPVDPTATLPGALFRVQGGGGVGGSAEVHLAEPAAVLPPLRPDPGGGQDDADDSHCSQEE